MIKKSDSSSIKSDIIIGIIIAFISIPISMGYSQIAGMPVIYGLYGSILPIVVFGLLTSSPQFVFGVDAAPCAVVGGLLSSLGIAAFSKDAISLVPLVTLCAATWLLLFYLMKAGKYVNYISDAVMGGFITGIGLTIILMQIPKLFGGQASHGELFRLISSINAQYVSSFNAPSLFLGVASIILIQAARKINPRIPMSVIVMVLGTALGLFVDFEKYGIALLPHVESGLPHPVLPSFSMLIRHPEAVVLYGFVVAVIIFSETLLATNSLAQKRGYKVDNNRELLAYSMGNFAAAVFGCTPINGSVSRSTIADQYGVKSQVMSFSAGITMLVILLFATPLIEFMPVSVLTAIVISALMNILELEMAGRLYRTDKFEFLVFVFAFLGVVLFGTIYGVLIGVLLSFTVVVMRASNPPMYEIGCIPGQYGFYSLTRTRNARRIKGVLMFNFSGPLFFANIEAFTKNLEDALRENTEHIIIDSTGITSIDMSAARRLKALHEKYRKKGIDFVLAGHPGTVNDQLRRYSAEVLIRENAVKRTRTLALKDMGITEPYELDIEEGYNLERKILSENDRIEDFEWMYGTDADRKMEEIASAVAREVIRKDRFDDEEVLRQEERISEGHWSSLYENEILDMLDTRLASMSDGSFDFERIELEIDRRRHEVEEELKLTDPEALDRSRIRREEIMSDYRKADPGGYRRLERNRRHMYDEPDYSPGSRDTNRFSPDERNTARIRRKIIRKK